MGDFSCLEDVSGSAKNIPPVSCRHKAPAPASGTAQRGRGSHIRASASAASHALAAWFVSWATREEVCDGIYSVFMKRTAQERAIKGGYLSQTITSSDLIPNENITRNKMGFILVPPSSYLSSSCIVRRRHVTGGATSLRHRIDGWSRFAVNRPPAHNCTAAIAAEVGR